jgi:adenine deaminase
VNENFAAAQEGLSLSDEDLAQLARNSFEAAFLPPEEKQALVRRVDEYVAAA